MDTQILGLLILVWVLGSMAVLCFASIAVLFHRKRMATAPSDYWQLQMWWRYPHLWLKPKGCRLFGLVKFSAGGLLLSTFIGIAFIAVLPADPKSAALPIIACRRLFPLLFRGLAAPGGPPSDENPR